jgi:hypothetical protein
MKQPHKGRLKMSYMRTSVQKVYHGSGGIMGWGRQRWPITDCIQNVMEDAEVAASRAFSVRA